jgi:glyoxylase-like metal-dependent hydrolase (beta-lactamase superfamily II)
MPILRYELGPMDNNTYLVVDEATREAALIDPSFDSPALLPEILESGCTLRYVLNTHAHFDHVIGNSFFVAQTGALLALHHADLDLLHALPEQSRMFGVDVPPSPDPTLFLTDNQTLTFGETTLRVLHTPGHSPGGVTFCVEDVAIVGDCLFARSIGRTDLPGASLETLLHSIHTRLLTLPDETRVLPGHGPSTTIGQERRRNPYLQSDRAF